MNEPTGSKTCNRCGETKPVTEFYLSRGWPRSRCKVCVNELTGALVAKRRRTMKATLVAEHGGCCIDCGLEGPPFVFDFDHRDPTEKDHGVKGGDSLSLARFRAEAEKCDLVCAVCHRWRTHRQRCDGCEHCAEVPQLTVVSL